MSWALIVFIVITSYCFYPLIQPQYEDPYSPHYSPYISYVTSWENLIKHLDI